MNRCERCRAPARVRWCSNACKSADYYECVTGKPRMARCRACGDEMWWYRRDARYCCATCRMAAYRRRVSYGQGQKNAEGAVFAFDLLPVAEV